VPGAGGETVRRFHKWAIHFTARSVESVDAVVDPKRSRSLAQLTGRFAPDAVSQGVLK